MTEAPKNLGVDPFTGPVKVDETLNLDLSPDLIGHFGTPWSSVVKRRRDGFKKKEKRDPPKKCQKVIRNNSFIGHLKNTKIFDIQMRRTSMKPNTSADADTSDHSI